MLFEGKRNTCQASCLTCIVRDAAGGAGGAGQLPAGGAKRPQGAEAAAGEDGQHCHWADVPGESGD